MKKIIDILVICLLFTIVMTSCFKDDSNESVSELDTFRVDTSKIASLSFTIKQFETLNLPSNLIYDGDKSKLNYYWITYPYDYDYNTGRPVDTIATTENLQTPISIAVNKYYLEFGAVDVTTGRRTTQRYIMSVSSNTGTGLMVLYNKDGKADCDMIKSDLFDGQETESGVVRNVYSRANAHYTLLGEAKGLGSYKYYTTAKYILLYTDQDVVKLNPDDMSVLQGFSEAFYDAPAVRKPEYYYSPLTTDHMGNDPYDIFINNGRCHVDIVAYAGGDPRFNAPLIGDYTAAPFTLMGYGGQVVVYDVVNRRFLCCGIFDSQLYDGIGAPSGKFDYNNVAKDLVYMGWGYGVTATPSRQYMAYAIFKNVPDDGGRWLYAMDMSANNRSAYIARSAIDLSSCPDIATSTNFSFGERGPVVYYSSSNKVYLLDAYTLDDNSATATSVWTFPSDEIITCMELPRHAGLNLSSSMVSKYLFVGTYNSTTKEGKMYVFEVDIANGSIIGTSPVLEYGGFGEIKDVDFKFV